jgi:hypothetical protein
MPKHCTGRILKQNLEFLNNCHWIRLVNVAIARRGVEAANLILHAARLIVSAGTTATNSVSVVHGVLLELKDRVVLNSCGGRLSRLPTQAMGIVRIGESIVTN